MVELREHPDLADLDLSPEDEAAFVADAHVLVDAYLALEDPAAITPIGLELQLEAQVGGLLMRGIIDRLEEDADGSLVVTDYKTGKAPSRPVRAGPPRAASTSTPSCASRRWAAARA